MEEMTITAIEISISIVAITCTCGGIVTRDESNTSRGKVDTLPATNDVMM